MSRFIHITVRLLNNAIDVRVTDQSRSFWRREGEGIQRFVASNGFTIVTGTRLLLHPDEFHCLGGFSNVRPSMFIRRDFGSRRERDQYLANLTDALRDLARSHGYSGRDVLVTVA